jgi:hypothetical protein
LVVVEQVVVDLLEPHLVLAMVLEVKVVEEED